MEKRFAWAVPPLALGQWEENKQAVYKMMERAKKDGAAYLVLPRLCLTGYSCEDLFSYDFFLDGQKAALRWLMDRCPKGLTCVTSVMKQEGERLIAFANGGEVFPKDVVLTLDAAQCEKDQVNLLPLAHVWTIGSIYGLLDTLRGTRTVFCSCGQGESTSRVVYSGVGGMVRGGVTDYGQNGYGCLAFDELEGEAIPIPAAFPDPKRPFVPKESGYLEEGLAILTAALRRRLDHLGTDRVVVGVSGGLDSTLALLICYRAIANKSDITGITMPCFGTSSRTRGNAQRLMEQMGITSLCIPIDRAVQVHFADIGQDMDDYSVTYENAQARERMQVLFDYANKIGGINVGTGDMSEMMLGFTTFGGDHLSMYALNAGVPKTLVRALVAYAADCYPRLSEVLADILDTPVSPELLPGGKQYTENLLGQYLYHDFILYHTVQNRLGREAMANLLQKTFGSGKGNLDVFYRRMTAAQFKRNCVADSPQVVGFSLAPGGAFRLPSDSQMVF